MARVPDVAPEGMTVEQKRVYQENWRRPTRRCRTATARYLEDAT